MKFEFSPESEQFEGASEEYKDIWETEGSRIIEILENISGLKFSDRKINGVIFEGVSTLNWNDEVNFSMKLRASYPTAVKKATIVHELGHLLLVQIKKRPVELDEHRILFLFLYDVWTELYGTDFANRAVEVEKKRKGIYDYDSAWTWALSLSKEERAQKLKEIIRQNK